MADMASLSSLLDKNAVLFASYELWANANVALVAGTVDDPDSFNATGGKTGALGYYPVSNVNGQTVYVPCLARLMAIAQGNLDPAILEAALSASVNATNAAAAAAALRAGESAASATSSANSAIVSGNQAAIATSAAGTATTQAGIATNRAAAADADAIATAADRAQTTQDRLAADADAAQTASDRIQTGADRAQTNTDRINSQAAAQTATDKLASLQQLDTQFRADFGPLAGRVATVEAKVAQLQYAGVSITAMSSNPLQAEIGSTVTAPTITITRSGANPTAQTLTWPGDSFPLAAGDTSKVLTGKSFTVNTTFTWTATDGNAPAGAANTSASRTTQLQFLAKAYWGVLDSTTITDDQLKAFADQAFASARGRSVTYNASAGGYPYYAWPASLGDIASVTVGGLAFTDYTVVTRNVVNASGATVSMKILRFNNRQTGGAIGVVFA